jgi:hypothetical protein
VERDATPTHYFLVEIWIERSTFEEAAPLARARVRDLTTQREGYVKSGAEIVEFLETSLEESGLHGLRWQEDLA